MKQQTLSSSTRGPASLSRRRFLQTSSAVAAASLLPPWLADQAGAAVPIGPSDGVLVLLTMAGGNDGLNTFIPIGSGHYYDARRELAFNPGETHSLTPTRGLNKHLPFLKSKWDQGQLAVVEGIGTPQSTLSHFVSAAQVMSARADGKMDGTGWLGRYIDGFSADPFRAMSISNSVPLVVNGRHRSATAVPEQRTTFFEVGDGEPTHDRQLTAIRAMANGTIGRGGLGDAIGDVGRSALNLADRVGPLLQSQQQEPKIVTKMRLAARLINANLGVRVISVVFGDFDSHAEQAAMHRDRMIELDDAMRSFFGTLNSAYAGRTLVVGTSEFGRRVNYNGSGTDHGTANSLFVVGAGAVGGFHGDMPSLVDLDRDGNLKATLDYRQFYANLTSKWLRADPHQIIGRDYPDLGFLKQPMRTSTPTPPVIVMPPGSSDPNEAVNGKPIAPVDPPLKQRAQIARLYLASFQRLPDEAGHNHWVDALRSGRSLSSIADDFATTPEFVKAYEGLSHRKFVNLIYRNVLGRSSDVKGLSYWVGVLESGASQGAVIVGFSESDEFVRSTARQIREMEAVGPVGRLYRAYFLRAPDRVGLEYWINTGLPLSAISSEFATSQEFTKRYGKLDNEAFVRLIYRNVLKRKPDNAGLAYWTTELDNGASRGAVMLGFSDSPEFAAKVKKFS